MLIRAKRLNSNAGQLKPTQQLEQRIWPVWVAVIMGWNCYPVLAYVYPTWLTAIPDTATTDTVNAIRLLAAVIGVLCFAVTVNCWIQMKESWGIATTPGVKTRLITTGLYAWVRHPIYALSVTLMTMTAIVVPSPLVLLIAAIHITFMHIKARTEEAELLKLHGEDYQQFCHQTGRFVPKLWRQRAVNAS